MKFLNEVRSIDPSFFESLKFKEKPFVHITRGTVNNSHWLFKYMREMKKKKQYCYDKDYLTRDASE